MIIKLNFIQLIHSAPQFCSETQDSRFLQLPFNLWRERDFCVTAKRTNLHSIEEEGKTNLAKFTVRFIKVHALDFDVSARALKIFL